MKKLAKYILITAAIILIYAAIFSTFDTMKRNGVFFPTRISNEVVGIPAIYSIVFPVINFIYFFLSLLLVIFLCAKYVHENKTTKEYFKSYLILLTYVIVSILASFILPRVLAISGEDGIIFGFWLLQVVVTSILVAIISSITYSIARNKI